MGEVVASSFTKDDRSLLVRGQATTKFSGYWQTDLCTTCLAEHRSCHWNKIWKAECGCHLKLAMIPYLLTCTAKSSLAYCLQFMRFSIPRKYDESHQIRFSSWNKQELRRHRPICSLSVLVVAHATDVSLCTADDGPNRLNECGVYDASVAFSPSLSFFGAGCLPYHAKPLDKDGNILNICDRKWSGQL